MTQDSYDNTNGENAAPRNNQLARRDFSGTSLSVGSAASDALVAKARADTEARWIMAMRRPRHLDEVRQLLLKECRRPGFAEVAVYEVPRADKKITGPSIRFAEVAVRCMTNIQPEAVTISDDDEHRLVRCAVTDYESNVTWSRDITIAKTVERKYLKKGQQPIAQRINSSGERVYIVEATDDDVNTKESALVSKTLRTLILRHVPGHLVDEAMEVCNAVFADKAAKDPDSERVKVLDTFAQLGMMASDVEEILGHTTERMAPVEIAKLRKLYTAISDGHVTWADAIETARAEREKAKPTTAPAAAATTNAAPAPAQPAAPAATSQPAPATNKPARGTAALKNKLDKATEDARAKDAARATASMQEHGNGGALNNEQRDAARTTKPDPETEPEPGWMAGREPSWSIQALPRNRWPDGTPDPADGSEYRLCRGCDGLIEVATTEVAGAQCYACSQA